MLQVQAAPYMSGSISSIRVDLSSMWLEWKVMNSFFVKLSWTYRLTIYRSTQKQDKVNFMNEPRQTMEKMVRQENTIFILLRNCSKSVYHDVFCFQTKYGFEVSGTRITDQECKLIQFQIFLMTLSYYPIHR